MDSTRIREHSFEFLINIDMIAADLSGACSCCNSPILKHHRPVHLGSDMVAGEATKVLTIFVDSVCDDLCFVMWHTFMLEKDKIG